jgi:hypothetical protein
MVKSTPKVLVTVRFAILILTGVLAGCAKDIPPLNCVDPDVNCYIDHAVKAATVVRANIDYWSNVNLIAQVLIVVFGIVSTIMIALQGDDNRYWTRPIGLISTALVTGLTSALVSFHVVGNVDKLVDIYSKIGSITNQLESQLEPRTGGKTPEEFKKMYKDDSEFRTWYGGIIDAYVKNFNDLKVDMLKISGSAAQLNASPPSTSETNVGGPKSETPTQPPSQPK